MTYAEPLAGMMKEVAGALLGTPNVRLSSERDGVLRFGTNGSIEVNFADGWFADYEANVRGGVLDLIAHKAGIAEHAAAFRWLEEHGIKEPSNDDDEAVRSTFYDYRDEAGAVLFRVERRQRGSGKTFVQCGPDGLGGFASRKGCMQGVRRVPYRLPELIAADLADIVFVCEGEKDADRLAAGGLIATTNPGGAGKFLPDFAGLFQDRRVIVLEDNDEAGRGHARDVAAKLGGVAAALAIVRLPGADKSDVSDWIANGGSAFDLRLKAEAALAEGVETFPLADLAAWAQTPPEPKAFVMSGFIPQGEVTLLTGAGGANKSTFGMQLCASAAAGTSMLGAYVVAGSALYLTCEDDERENHWRLQHIASRIGTMIERLAKRLHVVSLRGRLNNELATFDADGRLRVAPAYKLLHATIKATGARLVVLDNVAHLFAGNENDRMQVTGFVNLLHQLCRDLNCTIVLVAHPNKGGATYSGSTAWLNAVRSQLVLEHPESNPDPDCRVLSIGKANYARTDQQIAFRWHDFALVRDDELPTSLREEMAVAAAAAGDNGVFLACLAARAKDGLVVSPNASPNYAPTQFEAMPAARGIGKDRLRAAMERLLALGTIEVFDHENRGRGRTIKALRLAASPSPDAFPNASRTWFPNSPEQFSRTPPHIHPYTTYREGAALEAAAPSQANGHLSAVDDCPHCDGFGCGRCLP